MANLSIKSIPIDEVLRMVDEIIGPVSKDDLTHSTSIDDLKVAEQFDWDSFVMESIQEEEAVLLDVVLSEKLPEEELWEVVLYGKTKGIPTKNYLLNVYETLAGASQSSAVLTNFLHSLASEGFEECLTTGDSRLTHEPGWWLEDIRDGFGIVPKLQFSEELANFIKGCATSVMKVLLRKEEFCQALVELSETSHATSATAEAGLRKIAGALISVDNLFDRAVTSSAFSQYSGTYPDRRNMVEYRGLAVLALDQVRNVFCASLLNQILKNDYSPVSASALAALSEEFSKLSRNPSVKPEWGHFAPCILDRLKNVLPSAEHALFACKHNQKLLQLSQFIRDNPMERLPSVPDYVRPDANLRIVREKKGSTPHAVALLSSQDSDADLFTITLNSCSPIENTIGPRDVLTMGKVDGTFSLLSTDFPVSLNEDELIDVPPQTLTSYLQNVISNIQHDAVEVWQDLPQLFSQLPFLRQVTLSLGDDSIGFICLESDRDIVLGHLESDISFSSNQVLETSFTPHDSTEPLVQLILPKSCIFDSEPLEQGDLSEIVESSTSLRDKASKIAGKITTYKLFEKILTVHFDVTIKDDAGKGSHLMLYRSGNGWPIGQRVYNDEVPLRKSVVLKSLKGLGISFEEFIVKMKGAKEIV